ncbi:hypothetical protein [Egicoccus halophilus]|uniref:Uncharacterized protein n=1 Tax=Egicoccus halophilus TaxID=1670830 RepID=A0A8J3EUK5_9ACTN|nr:hypothetical protein [Egicoccus halophilus]GGI06061.1 hypothetical protein GCM10011354_17220 [Egicoccus halophilus]
MGEGTSTVTRPAVASAGAATLRRWAPFALVVLGWAALLPFVGHYGNPDGPSYAVVAERWLAGDLPAAVNGYWGPLLSWLAVPLLAVGVPALTALRVVLLVGAVLLLFPLGALCRRAGASAWATDVLLLATAPFLVYNALFGLYADVLMSAALLRSLEVLLRPSEVRVRAAVSAGVWAGLAVLARSYAAPVALVALPLAVLCQALLGPPGRVPTRRVPVLLRRALPAVAAALAGLLVVVGAWAAALTAVYGTPTWSTAAGFNSALVAPGSAGNPFNVPGLYEPVRPEGFSAWEEPAELPVPVRDEYEGEGLGERDATGRLALAVANGRIALGSVLRRGAPFVLLALVALAAAARRREPPAAALVAPLLTGAVAAGGLLLIIAIERYLWFPILTLVPAAAVGLDAFAVRPRWRLVVGVATVVTVTLTSLHGLLPRVGAHERVSVVAAALDEGLEGRAATVDDWQATHLLCFRVGCDYLGRPEARDAAGIAEELHAAEVDLLLVWAGDEDEVAGLETPDDGRLLTVYDVGAEGLRPRLAVGAGS